MMRRRKFFAWVGSTLLPPLVFPRWARAQALSFASSETATLRTLASVVLPASLGPARIDGVVDEFKEWLRNYKAGAEMGAGYGFPAVKVLPANPMTQYGEQFRQLESAAAARGAIFTTLDPAARRSIVEASLRDARIDRLPSVPDGKHVAADLMAFFFGGSDGEDFLYGAHIRRDECRGLVSSGERPERKGSDVGL